MSWTISSFKNTGRITSGLHSSEISIIKKDLNLSSALSHIYGVLQNINRAIIILKPSDDLHYNFFYAAIRDLDKKIKDINSAYDIGYQQKMREALEKQIYENSILNNKINVYESELRAQKEKINKLEATIIIEKEKNARLFTSITS